MDVKELRIGNFLEYSTIDNDFNKIDRKIYVEDLIRIINCDYYYQYYPILLTEEWLKKFGFENSKTQDKFYTKGNNIGISTADNKFRFIQGNFVCQLVIKELQFVHELQNLYYAITGTELEINL